MNPGLKQRLVGAVVLIALAVIFLPMLLPGNNDSTMPLFGSNVPDAPAKEFDAIEIPLQLPPQAPASETSVVDQPQAGDVASDEQPQLPQQTPEASQPPTTKSASAPPPAAPSKDNDTSTKRSAGEAWAVQLGSFSSSVNALALQEKARKAGFSAYVEKVKSERGTAYRVRIGPEMSRERADTLRERVRGKLGMSGIVVPHKS